MVSELCLKVTIETSLYKKAVGLPAGPTRQAKKHGIKHIQFISQVYLRTETYFYLLISCKSNLTLINSLLVRHRASKLFFDNLIVNFGIV